MLRKKVNLALNIFLKYFRSYLLIKKKCYAREIEINRVGYYLGFGHIFKVSPQFPLLLPHELPFS
jgi:hypothetical protein